MSHVPRVVTLNCVGQAPLVFVEDMQLVKNPAKVIPGLVSTFSLQSVLN